MSTPGYVPLTTLQQTVVANVKAAEAAYHAVVQTAVGALKADGYVANAQYIENGETRVIEGAMWAVKGLTAAKAT